MGKKSVNKWEDMSDEEVLSAVADGTIYAVVYARYSSRNQKELSIDGQVRECTAYAKRKGYTVVGSYIDRALSAKSDARPNFLKMVQDSAKHRFSVIICYKLNRFSRNRYDTAIYKAKLRKNGVRVVYAQEDIPDGPEGIIVESILEGMAEYYSADLAENVNRGMYDTAVMAHSNGGHISYGYLVGEDKKYYIDDTAAPIVRRIFLMWNEGARMRDILDYVNGLGVVTKLGNAFSNSTIASILRNRRYTGVYLWRDVEIKDGIPPIITDEIFNKAQQRSQGEKKMVKSGKPVIAYDLTTKMFCGVCGMAMVGESGKSCNGEKYRYYSCLARKRDHNCKKKNVRKDEIENNVIELTRRNIFRPEVIENIIKSILTLEEKERESGMLATLTAQEKEVSAGIRNITKAVEQGMFSPALQNRLNELEEQLANLQTSIAHETLMADCITRDQLHYLFTELASGDPTSTVYRRRLIDTFVNAIYLTDDEIAIVYNYRGGQERLALSDLPFPMGKKETPSDSSDSVNLGGA